MWFHFSFFFTLSGSFLDKASYPTVSNLRANVTRTWHLEPKGHRVCREPGASWKWILPEPWLIPRWWPLMSAWARGIQLSCPRFLPYGSREMIQACCVKLVNFAIICYSLIDDFSFLKKIHFCALSKTNLNTSWWNGTKTIPGTTNANEWIYGS